MVDASPTFTTLFSSSTSRYLPIVAVRIPSFPFILEVSAVLDCGSTDCFVTEWLVRRLGLRQFPVETEIHGVGDKTTKASTAVRLKVEKLGYELKALVLPQICGQLATLPVSAYNEKTGTLDVERDPEPRQIDLLIGVAQTFDAIKSAKPLSRAKGMFFVDTVFGPCLTGETDLVRQDKPQSLLSNTALHDYLGRFFRVE